MEHLVLVRQGELLRGVLDKNAIGASNGGLVHAAYELYGPHVAARLLDALGRLLSTYLQFAGHTCGIDDLVLTPSSDAARQRLVDSAEQLGSDAARAFLKSRAGGGGDDIDNAAGEGDDAASSAAVRRDIAALLRSPAREDHGAALDGHMMSSLSTLASNISKAVLPNGLQKPFPQNCFSLMVSTGAKGSTVNQSLISCALGQQVTCSRGGACRSWRRM